MTIPSITDEDDWKTWARKLSVFLSTQEDRGGRALVPQPILLSHTTDSLSNIGLERNFTPGIMLFDPVNSYIILSRDDIWAPIFDALTTAFIFNAAAYGSMGISAPAAGLDIPVGSFIIIDEFDSFPTAARGINFDFDTDLFSFDFEGIYRLTTMIAIEHNDLNAGRQFTLRLFNVTEGIPSIGAIIGVARNSAVTNFTSSLLVQIDADDVGDEYRLEVGNADTIITSVVWETLNVSIDMVSEWREPLIAEPIPA